MIAVRTAPSTASPLRKAMKVATVQARASVATTLHAAAGWKKCSSPRQAAATRYTVAAPAMMNAEAVAAESGPRIQCSVGM